LHLTAARCSVNRVEGPSAGGGRWTCRSAAEGSEVDWASVFDVTLNSPPGATDAVIEQFVAEIARPMSADEIREVNAGQRNPFPASDPLHSAWRPFDAAAWVIPNRPLPPAYLSLLRWADGAYFGTGDRWFQFFPTLSARSGVRAMMIAYQLPQYMPGAVPVAFNGGGTFYLLDMRQPAVGGEYPVVCAHAGYLAWEPDAWCVVADSFLAACRGRVNVDDMRCPEAEQGAAADGGA